MARAVIVLFLGLLPLYTYAQSPSEWSQDVNYEMDIHLDADEHQYTGHQTLEYTNNSPDTLHTVYYHLYFNAFHPESMMAERHRHLPDPDRRTVPRIFELSSDEQGWHRIHALTQDGQAVEYEINDTVMRVALNRPIAPGETSTFTMKWRAQVPLQTRRSGRDSRGDSIDYTMTQWYPKLAEYDERGWHANPYINREYYAPFGSFDVKITLPADYTVGATGTLQNPQEIGHGYDLHASGTWEPADASPDTDSLTWHFRADNVHNFAWSADPDYIHDQVVWGDYTFHLLYKEEVEALWRPLRKAMPALTRFFGEKFGAYPYPQMTVAQGGDGGMEYPMFTVVTGYSRPEFDEMSSWRSVLGTTVHEYAHMWYYSALGSNEADYAWIDEGFTSYATEEGLAHLLDRAPDHQSAAESEARLQKQGLTEPRSTPADWFQTNTAYGVASYSGGELFVDMLGYVIGDRARDDWFHRIYEQRQGDHPDPYDLELFAEQESRLMLDWYFWQFTKSTRTVDDAIGSLEETSRGDTFEASFTLERKGEAVLPHDVKLTLQDGSTQWVHVPLLTMHGHKSVPDDWLVAEPWPWVAPTKTVTVDVPAPVEKAELDPNGRTPDVNRLNNTTEFPLTTRFLRAPESDWFNYELGVRPLAGYAHDFGFGAGVQARGQYFTGDHSLRATATVWPQVLGTNGQDPALASEERPIPGDNETGSWFDGLDYELRYSRSVPSVGPRVTIEAGATKHLGILEHQLSVQTPLRSRLNPTDEVVRVSLGHQLNPSDRAYGRTHTDGLTSNPWIQSHVASGRLEYELSSDRDRLSAFFEAGSSLARFSLHATRFAVEGRKDLPMGPVRGTAAIRLGLGPELLFPQKQFLLGGRSLEAQWRHDAFRQTSALFERPIASAHFVGFDSAGPVAYLRANPILQRGLISRPGLSGNNLLAGRLSIGESPFPHTGPLAPLTLSVFSGYGSVWNDGPFLAGFDPNGLIADAGFGVRYNVSELSRLQRWTAQSDVLQNLDLVARFPVWASDPGLIDDNQEEFAFRWLIGIQL